MKMCWFATSNIFISRRFQKPFLIFQSFNELAASPFLKLF